MSWLGQDEDKFLLPYVDAFILAEEGKRTAKRQGKKAEEVLIEKMAIYELDIIERGEWYIELILPNEGDAYLEVTRRTSVDFG